MKLFLIYLISLSCFGSNFSSNVDATFKEAKREKKPIVIDFYGIWCPPCNELDETVFESPIFKEKAQAFKLLKVDADKPESWKIKHRYNVGGYPTVIFTNENGDEVYRIVGYRPLKEFLRIMDLVLKTKGKAFEQACKSKDIEDTWRCAVISSERDDQKTATEAFKKLETKLGPKSPRYALARAYFVEHAENDDLKRDGFERLMKEMPASPLALAWATEYLGLFKDESPLKPKKEVLSLVIENAPKAMMDPSMDELGMPITDHIQMRAEVLSALGQEDAANVAWKEAAYQFEKLTQLLPKGVNARGFTIERVYCLEQAGDIDTALELANNYREKYPEEFTFHFQVASILKRQKKFDKAIPVAQQAYKHSYGDNKIRAGTLLVQLYATQSNKDSAKSIYEEIIKEMKPQKDLKVRTHRYLTKLEDEMKKL